MIKCGTCQKEFQPSKKTSKYCSRKCSSSAPRKHKGIDESMILSLYKEGMSGFEIAKRMDVSNSVIYRMLSKNGVTRSNKENSVKYLVDHNYFDEISDRDKAYWLGFLYADGFIIKQGNQKSVGLTLATKDREHLEAFKSALSSQHPIHDYISNNGNEYSRLLITSEQMFDQLSQKGCIERKTTTLTFPPNHIVPKVYQSDFIRGYFDGDGSFSKCSPKSKLPYSIKIMGTSEMIHSIIEVAGIERFYIGKRHKNNVNNYSLEINHSEEIMKFSEYIYQFTGYTLSRKYKRYQELRSVVYTGNSVDH